jgi:hypothetical protein
VYSLLQCKTVAVEGGCFTLLQDDLLHPIMGGNKLRKLPAIHAEGYTDVVGTVFLDWKMRGVSDWLSDYDQYVLSSPVQDFVTASTVCVWPGHHNRGLGFLASGTLQSQGESVVTHRIYPSGGNEVDKNEKL